MIYTLEYLKKEAELIVGHWNGSDERFVDGSGETRTEEDVDNAQEVLDKIETIEDLVKELSI